MRLWPRMLFATPLLLGGCVPYAGYYYHSFYAATPYPRAPEDAAECKPVSMNATIDGRPETVTGTVCRGPDGVWHVQPDETQVP